MVKQYRKKPVCIEAVQFTRSNWDEVVSFTNNVEQIRATEKDCFFSDDKIDNFLNEIIRISKGE